MVSSNYNFNNITIQQKKELEEFAHEYLKDFVSDYKKKYGESGGHGKTRWHWQRACDECFLALAHSENKKSKAYLQAKEIIREETKNSQTKSFELFSLVLENPAVYKKFHLEENNTKQIAEAKLYLKEAVAMQLDRNVASKKEYLEIINEACQKRFSQAPTYLKIIGPLTDSQKLQIDKYVHGYLKNFKKAYAGKFGNKYIFQECEECFQALSDPKTAKEFPDALPKAKEILTLVTKGSRKKSFESFVEVLADPSKCKQFNLDPNDKAQVEAAKILINKAVYYYMDRGEDLPEEYLNYVEDKSTPEMSRLIFDTVRRRAKSKDPLTLENKKELFKFVGIYLEGFHKKFDAMFSKTFLKRKTHDITKFSSFYGRYFSSKEIKRLKQLVNDKSPNRQKPNLELLRKDICEICLKALSKTDDRYSQEYRKMAQAVVEQTLKDSSEIPEKQRSFEFLRQVVKDPTLIAEDLGIDPTKQDKIAAAQIFLKNAIQYYHDYEKQGKSEEDEFELIVGDYWKQLIGNYPDEEDRVSAKQRMLFANDPVKKLNSRNKNPSSLDLVLANIHFESVPDVFKIVKALDQDTEVDLTPTREEIREILATNIKDLWEDPLTHHIIEALAKVIKEEKLNVFVSGYLAGSVGEFQMSSFGKYNLETMGFYGNHHSIYLSFPFTRFKSAWKGLFTHEATHLLLGRIVQYFSSPVKPGTKVEKELDKSLDSDMEHRKTLKIKNLTEDQKVVWEAFVNNLEQHPAYFGNNGFDPTNPKDLHTRRVEAIVRIMECYAQGVSLEDIKAIAPNLYEFYFKHTKPLIEKYTQK